MRKIINFVTLSIILPTLLFAKLNFKNKGVDSSLTGYPLYTFEVSDYSKENNFLEFYEKTKKVRKNENSRDISFLLEVPGKLGYVDRIDIKNNNFIIINNNGQLFTYSENEFLNIRTKKENSNSSKSDILTSRIMDEKFYGKPGLSFTVLLNRNATEEELKNLTAKLFKENTFSKKTFLHPTTKKKMNYIEYTFFYYLPKQSLSSSAYASFEVTNKGIITKNFINDLN
ncbi:MAG: hypothetical protein ACRC0F_10460 [Cetobacterium sp.]